MIYTKNLVRDRLSQQIARELEGMIAGKEILPGTRLPSERALATEFQVNRLVVREALRILEAKGLALTRPGRGTFAAGQNGIDPPDILSSLFRKDRVDPEVVDEIFLFRRYLEVALAKLAARRVRPSDLDDLRRHVQVMRSGAAAGDRERVAQADEAFHRQIADMAGSQVLARLAKVLWGALRSYQKLYFKHCRRPETTCDGLDGVIEALAAGDTNAAAAAMEGLLSYGDQEFGAVVLNRPVV